MAVEATEPKEAPQEMCKPADIVPEEDSTDQQTDDDSYESKYDESLVFENGGGKGFRGPFYKRSRSTARDSLGESFLAMYGISPSSGDSVCFPSGMAAIGGTLSSLLKPSGIIVHGDELYTDVKRSIDYVCSKSPGAKSFAVDVRNSEIIVELFEEHGESIHVFHFESCTNPSGQMIDFSIFPKLRDLAPNCTFVCDNTWLTAVLFNPLDHGADIVVESCTKYASAGTCIGGVACGSADKMRSVREWNRVFGQFIPDTVMDLFSEQVPGMEERVRRASQNAFTIAREMEEDIVLTQLVDRVMYPGLASHPTHDVAKTYLKRGYPGCVWFHMSISRSRFQKKAPELSMDFKTSFGGPKCRLDPWPEGGPADKYDISDTGSEPGEVVERHGKKGGAWIRLSLGFDETVDEIIEKLHEDLSLLLVG